MANFHGYEMHSFVFEDRPALVALPHEPEERRRLALVTEYWDAFPEAAALPLLEKGFHVCFNQNDNRWGTDDTLDRKARFVRFVQREYRLSGKCVPVGMSCGGLIGLKFAARYPELVSCLYLDAPVVNYMSCPCGFGRGRALAEDNAEILNALGLKTIGELMAYRDMPLDRLPALLAHRIPLVLVAGDSDMVVPFDENGLFVQRAYKNAGIPLEVYVKPGCDHHPHGLPDPAPVVEFLLRHSA